MCHIVNINILLYNIIWFESLYSIIVSQFKTLLNSKHLSTDSALVILKFEKKYPL